MTKFPEVHVQITGEDGNIFSIGGRAGRALREAGVAHTEIAVFYAEVAAAPSYDAALQTVMRWVDVS